MDLQKGFRDNFNQNKNALVNLASQLLPQDQRSSTPSRSTGKKGPCYIATMAYGDYDHPQVMVLRDFRDQWLNKYILGKWFIRAYYRYSPKLVEALEDKKNVNNFIRIILNQFIKLIK